MKWRVDYVASRIGHDLDMNGNDGFTDAQCLSLAGYIWDYSQSLLFERNLLAVRGFDNFTCYDLRWDDLREADDNILRTGDPDVLKVLLEKGYVFKNLSIAS